MKSAADHGLTDAVSSIEAFDEQHANQVSETSISVHIRPRFEGSNPHGITQSIIFQMKHLEVSDREEEQMNQLVWDIEVAQSMTQSNDR